MNIVIKYILKLFLLFCVVYTVGDIYKKRKKYMWLIKFVNGNIKFIAYTFIGESTMNVLMNNKPKKLKKKI